MMTMFAISSTWEELTWRTIYSAGPGNTSAKRSPHQQQPQGAQQVLLAPLQLPPGLRHWLQLLWCASAERPLPDPAVNHSRLLGLPLACVMLMHPPIFDNGTLTVQTTRRLLH